MIKITKSDLREFLHDEMERDPTNEEVEEFEDYVVIDIGDWLRDNYKAWRDP